MMRGQVCVTCRQLPKEGVGWLGPGLEGAQGRVSQDPRLLGTEHNHLKMGAVERHCPRSWESQCPAHPDPSPQLVTCRHAVSSSVCDTLAITHPVSQW